MIKRLLVSVLLGLVFSWTVSAAAKSPAEEYGLLKISNGHLCSASGEPVQLKGMSLFWSQWSGSWYTAATVNNLADQWKGSLIRAAMGVENGGYLTHPEAEKAKVKAVVDAAIAKGIYVIIDWHDHHAENHLEQSKAFFAEMAATYKNVPNVMFELYNEPMSVPWTTVKSYAEAVIDEIRKAGAQNVIIVGSPTWSQDVHKAAADPIQKSNIAYTLHFYAGTHKESIRNQASQAMQKGLAIVATEWGTCDASGNGGFNEAESEKWMEFLDAHKISWANWSLFNKNETASAFKPGTLPKGDWKAEDLTPSGRFVLQHLAGAGRPSNSRP